MTEPVFEVVELDVVRFAVAQEISKEELRGMHAEIIVRESARGAILLLQQFLAGKREIVHFEEVKWPATWWDALKHQHAPAWFQERWPVRWASRKIRTVEHVAVCPHLDCDPKAVHIRFPILSKPTAPRFN